MKQIIFLLLVLVLASCQGTIPPDDNTYSSYQDIQIKNEFFNIFLDFANQRINGTAHYECQAINTVTDAYFDVWNVNVTAAAVNYSGSYAWLASQYVTTDCNITKGINGCQLDIDFGKSGIPFIDTKIPKGQNFNLDINFTVSNNSEALTWLYANQTSSKALPYLYSQCQPTFCRSLFPLFDTPAIRVMWSANVTAPTEFNVYMSGNKIGVAKVDDFFTTHMFQQPIGVPSYLISIVAGNLVQQPVGMSNVTFVISEPDTIEKDAQELQQLDFFLNTIQTYLNISYVWGTYKAVVLPPSFPMGGMENPQLNFYSPSIIIGDRSEVSVAIHEIAHSWTGNLVTCQNWTNFWLNEGFTVFLERKAQQLIYGPAYANMSAIIGNQSLINTIYQYKNNSYCSLFPNTSNQVPTDVVNSVQYEKGYQFLYFIESLIGPTNMQQLLHNWVQQYSYQVVNFTGFQTLVNFTIYQIFNTTTAANISAQIDWNTWIFTPGMPPLSRQYEFISTALHQANQLAEEFIELGGYALPSGYEAFIQWVPNQQFMFLDFLNRNYQRLNVKILRQLEQTYNLSYANNYELSWRWFNTTIFANYIYNYPQIKTFLGQTGRLKMIEPVYLALQSIGKRDLAIQWFEVYQYWYSPYAQIQIMSDLNI